MLYGARNEMKCQDYEGQNYFWRLQGAAEFSATARKTAKRRDREIRRANRLKPPVL